MLGDSTSELCRYSEAAAKFAIVHDLLKETKSYLEWYFILQYLFVKYSKYASSWTTRTYLPYTTNDMVADDLATKGAKSSASMVLVQIYPGIPA